jgi:phenylalanyl-tRNA synthetase beta chain
LADSALVDITNYVTIDLGRPLHVFDAEKLKGDCVMRFAREGEKLLALDGKEYALDPAISVIADENGPAAIGGIMGGEPTGCSEATTSVFLEVALFDPVATARSGRALGINSDARFRFERGVDPLSAEWGVDIATKLIQKFCEGEPSRVTKAGEMPKWERAIDFRPARVMALGGLDVPRDRQKTIFGRLGFAVADKAPDHWSVSPPSWRSDVEARPTWSRRCCGSAASTPSRRFRCRVKCHPHAAINPQQRRVIQAKRLLASRGLLEAVTYSFMPEAIAELFLDKDNRPLRLANPISADLDCMRPRSLGRC